MAQEIVKTIKIESPDGERTIAGLRKEIGGLRDQLLNLDKDSKEYEQTLQKLTKDEEELARATQIGKVAFSETKNELKQLKQQLDQLEPGTQQYIATFKRAADLTHTLSERQQVLKNSSNDLGTQLNNVRGIAQGMIGGMNALSAAMGLLGKDSDDVQKAMLKLQQGMAIVQGLQGMEGMINKLKGMTMAMRTATVSTKGLTGGIRALNAAIKANPVGLLIAALSALIIYGKDLFGWITKLIGGQEQLNAIWDKTKAIAVGLGNAIVNYLIMPVRTAIHYFATLGTLMKDIFTGNWSKIRTDFKDGVDQIKQDFVNGFSFMQNYKKGYDEQMIRNTKKRNEQLIKEQENLNKNYITKYEKDLDNYIKDQEAKLGADWKWTAEGKKYYENLFQTRMSMYKKDTDEYRKAQRDMWAYQREYQERIDKNKGGGSKGGSKGKSAADEEKERLEALQKIKEEYKAAEDYIGGTAKKVEDLYNVEQKHIKAINDYFDTLEKGTGQDYSERRMQELEDAHTRYLTEYSKLMKETTDKHIEEIERIAEADIAEIAREFEKKQLTEGVAIPSELLAEIDNIYKLSKEKIEKTLNEIDIAIKKSTEEGLSEESEQYQLLIAQKKNALAELADLEIEHIKEVADAEKKGYDMRLEEMQTYYEQAKKKQELQSKYLDNADNVRGMPQQRELEALDMQYDIEQQRINELVALYQEMATNLNLTYDQREEAFKNYLDAKFQLEDAELDHTIKHAELEKQIVEQRRQNYFNLASSLSSVLGSVAEAWEDEINAQVKAGDMSEEEGKKQFEYIKGLQIAEAVINTISGMIAAFTSAQSLGFPWGTIIGSANAAAVAAAGAAQIAKIQNTKFDTKNPSVGEIAAPAVAANPTADFNDQISGIGTGQNEMRELSNAVTNGMSRANLSVSVSEINSTQNRVSVREQEATW